MPTRKIVFLHHDQCGGRLSRKSAIKAWTHVSRRSWQEKPQQLTIKIWRPPKEPKDDLDRDEVEIDTPDDSNTILVPYSKFQQAYASKKGLVHVEPPADLARAEATFSTAYRFCERSVVNDRDRTETEWPVYYKVMYMISEIEFSIRNGIDFPASHSFRRAFASFEYAALRLTSVVTHLPNTPNDLDNLFHSLLPALTYAQSQKAYDVVGLFLKQFYGLTLVAGGATHPLTNLARNWLTQGTTPDLVLGILQAQTKARDARGCGDDSNDSFLVTKCELFGVGFSLQEAEYLYQQLISNLPREDSRYLLQFTNLEMARLYLAHGKHVEAITMLCQAPDDLAEWVKKGWKFTSPRTAPVSMMGVMMQLCLYGEVLAAQGKHESADTAFQQAIFAGRWYLQPMVKSHPTLIQVQQAYTKYLLGQNRWTDAAAIELAMDLDLKMFMLNVNDSE